MSNPAPDRFEVVNPSGSGWIWKIEIWPIPICNTLSINLYCVVKICVCSLTAEEVVICGNCEYFLL